MKIKKKPLEPVAVPEVKEHKPIFDRDNEVAECHRRQIELQKDPTPEPSEKEEENNGDEENMLYFNEEEKEKVDDKRLK